MLSYWRNGYGKLIMCQKPDINKGAITERIYNTFFAKVLEVITCDANVNGYGAFEELDANYCVAGLGGDLGVTITDFDSVSDMQLEP